MESPGLSGLEKLFHRSKYKTFKYILLVCLVRLKIRMLGTQVATYNAHQNPPQILNFNLQVTIQALRATKDVSTNLSGMILELTIFS